MRYFANCKTVSDIKRVYRALALEHHPDRGGDTAVMQEINSQYHAALESCHEQTTTGTDGKEHTYYYNERTEQAIMDLIAKLIDSGITTDCTVEIVGTWLWVGGNTKPHRQTLKEYGMRWHGKRQRWYFHTGTWKRRASRASFDDLRAAYGSQAVRDARQDEDDNRTEYIAA